MTENNVRIKFEGEITLGIVRKIFDRVKGSKIAVEELPYENFPDKKVFEKEYNVSFTFETDQGYEFEYDTIDGTLWVITNLDVLGREEYLNKISSDFVKLLKDLVVKFELSGFSIISRESFINSEDSILGLNYLYLRNNAVNEYLTLLFEQFYERFKDSKISYYRRLTLKKDHPQYRPEAEKLFDKSKEYFLLISTLSDNTLIEQKGIMNRVNFERNYDKDLKLDSIDYKRLLSLAEDLKMINIEQQGNFTRIMSATENLEDDLEDIFGAIFSHYYYLTNDKINKAEFFALAKYQNSMDLRKELLILAQAFSVLNGIPKEMVPDNQKLIENSKNEIDFKILLYNSSIDSKKHFQELINCMLTDKDIGHRRGSQALLYNSKMQELQWSSKLKTTAQKVFDSTNNLQTRVKDKKLLFKLFERFMLRKGKDSIQASKDLMFAL